MDHGSGAGPLCGPSIASPSGRERGQERERGKEGGKVHCRMAERKRKEIEYRCSIFKMGKHIYCDQYVYNGGSPVLIHNIYQYTIVRLE